MSPPCTVVVLHVEAWLCMEMVGAVSVVFVPGLEGDVLCS